MHFLTGPRWRIAPAASFDQRPVNREDSYEILF